MQLRQDDVMNQALAQFRVLTQWKCNVFEYAHIREQGAILRIALDIDDGKQALDAWQSKQYALLLTDCNMPVMDGFELTGEIRNREDAGDKRFPIIAITANALQGEADKCIGAGIGCR